MLKPFNFGKSHLIRIHNFFMLFGFKKTSYRQILVL